MLTYDSIMTITMILVCHEPKNLIRKGTFFSYIGYVVFIRSDAHTSTQTW